MKGITVLRVYEDEIDARLVDMLLDLNKNNSPNNMFNEILVRDQIKSIFGFDTSLEIKSLEVH